MIAEFESLMIPSLYTDQKMTSPATFARIWRAKVPQASSPSGKVTKTSTPSISVAIRNAASCPFQSFDCHMAKYSPAININPKNQRPKPTINPATAQTLLRLNTWAGAFSRLSNTRVLSSSKKGGQRFNGDDQRIDQLPYTFIGDSAGHQ